MSDSTDLGPSSPKKRTRDQSECKSDGEQDGHVENNNDGIGIPATDKISAKVVHLVSRDEDDGSKNKEFICYLAPHDRGWIFNSYEAYDSHYEQFHKHQCSECHKNFPSSRLLELHLAEYHDPIVDAKRTRGEKIYACFVEDCDKVCREPIRRRWHLIAKHNFPEDYNFGVITHGLGNARSMLRDPKRSKQAGNLKSKPPLVAKAKAPSQGSSSGAVSNSEPSSTSAASPEAAPSTQGEAGRSQEVNALTNSLASLKFVPRSVRFGRGGRRRGLARQQ